MKGLKVDSEGYHELSGYVETEKAMNIRFIEIDKELNIKMIMARIKEGNNIIFVDLKQILEDPGNLRIFVNKIRRASDEYAITMKLYGKSWLLILPENAVFHIGEE